MGTGTTLLGILDFLVTWAYVCDLYQIVFPIKEFSYTGLDRSDNCLQYSQHVAQAYAATLHMRHLDGHAPEAISERASRWAETASWVRHDLNMEPHDHKATLIVASNIINELSERGQSHLASLVAASPSHTVALIIEPGDQHDSQHLMTWRRRLVQQHPQIVSLGPCGAEFGNQLPAACTRCWSARRESLHQSLLYRAFRTYAARILNDERTFSDKENNLLSWSYVLVVVDDCRLSASVAPIRLDPQMAWPSEIVLTYTGSYRGKRSGTDFQVELHTDDDTSVEWHEFLQFCPGALSDASRLTLRRASGIDIPRLRHGDQIKIAGVSWTQTQTGGVKLTAGPHTSVNVGNSASGQPLQFLQRYDQPTRAAVDEMAYRLFGFPSMRQFQHAILERVLCGKSILGIAATGGGKSECFILPAMLLPGITLVVSPLKALMLDQYDRLSRRYGLKNLVTFLNGDVAKERQQRLSEIERGIYKLVYVTPEQLARDDVLMRLQRADQEHGIRYVALDEAHCISEWGHDFRVDYLNVVKRLHDWNIAPVCIALTATASPRVRDDICTQLQLRPDLVEDGGDVFVHSSNRPELNLVVRISQTTKQKIDRLLADLRRQQHDPGAAIIFMPWAKGSAHDWYRHLRPEVESFAAYLETTLRTQVAIYHGKMDDDLPDTVIERVEDEQSTIVADGLVQRFGEMEGRSRTREQHDFVRGRRTIMVATKGFGMGVDKNNVRLVLHRTPPASLEAYAQEAGRAGRDGQLATVVVHYSPDQPEIAPSNQRRRFIKSDHEIQSFFLRNIYIRSIDAHVLRAFLRQFEQTPKRPFYFTSNELVEFIDRCVDEPELAGLSAPYTWPEWDSRTYYQDETGQQTADLDLGHAYRMKTEYVERIVKVCYDTVLDTGTEVLLRLLERIDPVGARVVAPEILNWRAIANANTAFGKQLRAAGITDQAAFEGLLSERDLIPLAQRLELPITDTVELINAIATFGSRRRVHSDRLLTYRGIEAPYYGLAAGHEPPVEGEPSDDEFHFWRQYVGASSMTSDSEAVSRAKDRGRQRPIERDFIGWPEIQANVQRRSGWEVWLGPAFFDDATFAEYCLTIRERYEVHHQARLEAYRRLLTDYLGVNADGTLPAIMRGDCLRRVLLGYLETNEIIIGSCYSCNRCVPQENFADYPLELRTSAVVKISQELADEFAAAKLCVDVLPEAARITRLVGAIQTAGVEAAALATYLKGVTGRWLDDDENHRAALWLRMQAMISGLMEREPQELADNVRRLAEESSSTELPALWSFLRDVYTVEVHTPEITRVYANLCHHLEHYAEEAAVWEQLYQLAGQRQSGQSLQREAAMHLLPLYAPEGPLADADRHTQVIRYFLQESSSVTQGTGYYAQLSPCWNWSQVAAEAQIFIQAWRPTGAAATVCGYLLTGKEQALVPRAEQVVAYLAEQPRASVQETLTVLKEWIGQPPLCPEALLLQTFAVLYAVPDLQPAQLIPALRSLIEVAAVVPPESLIELLMRVQEYNPHLLDLYLLRVDLAHQTKDRVAEQDVWQAVVVAVEGGKIPSIPWRHQAHAALAELAGHAHEGQQASNVVYHQLLAARYAPDADTAEPFYQQVARTWTWSVVDVELEVLAAAGRMDDLGAALLLAWLDGTEARADTVARYIDETARVWQHWPVANIRFILSRLPRDVVQHYPTIAVKAIGHLHYPDVIMSLAPIALAAGCVLDSETVKRIAVVAYKHGSDGKNVLDRLTASAATREATYHALRTVCKLANWTAFEEWLNRFESLIAHDSTSEQLRMLRQARKLAGRQRGTVAVITQLQSIAETCFADPSLCASAHRAWHHLCVVSPDIVTNYLLWCGRSVDSEQYSHLLLDHILKTHIDLLTLLPTTIPITRWQRVIQFAQSVEHFKQQIGYQRGMSLTEDHCNLLAVEFDAAGDPEQADMQAVAFAQLRTWTGKQFLSTVRGQINALIIGGRFDLARRCAAVYPELRLGKVQVTVEQAIDFARARAEPRTTALNEDYCLVARHLLGTGDFSSNSLCDA